MFKVSKLLQPQSIQDMFIDTTAIHDRITRQSYLGERHPPKARLQITKHGFRFRGYRVWKQSLDLVKQVPTLKEFNIKVTGQIKSQLIEQRPL